MKPPGKQRIDQLLVERGLAGTRHKAHALILAGSVIVNGQKAAKPGQTVAADSAIELTAKLPYVSRGGLKLAAALHHFGIAPDGKVCLDIGSSTGGFTDCLLQHGALRVYAFDVGSGQLDWTLRNDPRVIVREQFNARNLKPEDVPERCAIAVCDVSFISVTIILPALPPLLDEQAQMVILVKPQFEVGRQDVGRGGIVRDPALHAAVCDKVRLAVESLGFRAQLLESPILGAEGNREFLLYADRH
ncbi:MAG TPA: TlyA family RNA methyltransferase [Bryobacteraceae bacterium]|nr:TlyA family RNA methyltransferase [Bryobacteraceae bacterium]